MLTDKQTVAYYRSSTNIQDDSVSMQKGKAEEYALYNSLVIEDEYPDDAVSARKNTLAQREQMKRLMDNIELGKIGTLLVYKRDRLARNAEELYQLFKLFKKHNIKVLFTSKHEPVMEYSGIGEIIEIILGAMAEQEVENYHDRQQAARESRFNNKEYITRVPFGYFNKTTELGNGKIEKSIEVDEEKRETIKLIFDELSTGNHIDLDSVANVLNNSGHRKKDKTGARVTPWKAAAIEAVIRHPLYKGDRYAYIGGRPFHDYYHELKIVESDQWEVVQDIVDAIKSKRGPRNSFNKDDFLLEGIASCAVCKKELTPAVSKQNNKQYAYYVCTDCGVRLSKRDFEDSVFNCLVTQFDEILRSDTKELKAALDRKAEELNDECKRLESGLNVKVEKLYKQTDNWLTTGRDQSEIDKLAADFEWLQSKQKEIDIIKADCVHYKENYEQLLEIIQTFTKTKLSKEPYEIKQKFIQLTVHSMFVTKEKEVTLQIKRPKTYEVEKIELK